MHETSAVLLGHVFNIELFEANLTQEHMRTALQLLDKTLLSPSISFLAVQTKKNPQNQIAKKGI